MKKALLVTLYGNSNYGNKLQNYACYRVLSDKGIDVTNIKNIRHLNYENYSAISEIKFVLSNLKYHIKNKKAIGSKYYGKRQRNFKDFSAMIPTPKKYFRYKDKELYDSYDYYVVGSDQVWNPYMALDDLSLFRGFNKGKKISMAASFAVPEVNEETKARIKEDLESFSAISVREDKGKIICDDILGETKSTVIVDPTMMLTKEDWKDISKKPEFRINNKYILLSFLGQIPSNVLKQIEEIARLKGYDIINPYQKNSVFSTCGPKEFLYLEENAELICTNSFHSAVFGIIFNTPILVCDRGDTKENMNSRIETLLNKFSLNHRKYTGKICEDSFTTDFSKVNEILAKERKAALDFVNKSFV